MRDTKMTIFVPVAPIVRKLEASAADLKALTNVPAGGRVPAYDYCDYSKVVVRKPWGHEYLIYENGDAAVWILYLAPGRQTSLHCHPGKVTSITVLSGSALCSVLEGAVVRTAGEVMSIGKGVFHRTRSTSDNGTFVMEIESPVNKCDLVRLDDDYGRQAMGYECADANSRAHNYRRAAVMNAERDPVRSFGSSTIHLSRHARAEGFLAMLRSPRCDSVNLVKGQICDPDGRKLYSPGSSFNRDDLRPCGRVSLEGPVEAIVVGRGVSSPGAERCGSVPNSESSMFRK